LEKLGHSETPEFVDTQPIPTGPPDPEGEYRRYYGPLLDLHRVGWIALREQTLKEDWPQAYESWLKIFELDKAWLKSARPITSHERAMRCLQVDLILLGLMKKEKAPENQAIIQSAVESLDADRTNPRRALIFSYLTDVNHLEHASQSNKSPASRWLTSPRNKALFRHDLNRHYGNLERFIENPRAYDPRTDRTRYFTSPYPDLVVPDLEPFFSNKKALQQAVLDVLAP
jgi:hypothetical protein